MRRRVAFLLAAAMLAGPAGAQTPDPSLPIRAAKIILVGDSTTAAHSGWGSSFCAHHVTAALACLNLARGGRSTLSYRAEGSWDIALAEMAVAGYAAPVHVLIQFGHNDQPGKPGRSTELETEFPDNLRRYVAEARAAGATPILVTPLVRRTFVDGRLHTDLEPWAEAVRAVGAETGTPVIDLHAMSAELVQAMGPSMAARLAQTPAPADVAQGLLGGTTPPSPAAPDLVEGVDIGQVRHPYDSTHLGRAGADLFAAQIARALIDAAPDLRRHIVP